MPIVDSGGEEVAEVVDKGEEITATAQVPKSPTSPSANAQEFGGSSTPTFINNPRTPTYFEVGHHFSFPAPPLTPFFVQVVPKQYFTTLL